LTDAETDENLRQCYRLLSDRRRLYFMIGRPETNTAQEDRTATTESVAAAAGARVTPTQPPLKVEPK
jgi:hypothetical protein